MDTNFVPLKAFDLGYNGGSWRRRVKGLELLSKQLIDNNDGYFGGCLIKKKNARRRTVYQFYKYLF